jgi:hypothetical protein
MAEKSHQIRLIYCVLKQGQNHRRLLRHQSRGLHDMNLLKPLHSAKSLVLLAGFVFAGFVFASTVSAQQPITYQGQIQQSGAPFSGMADLKFELYDSLTDGMQVGSTITHADWSVEAGLFQVELDFGAGSFGANPRWLQITVNDAILAPRQRVSAAPIALYSLDSGGGGSVWQVNGSSVFYADGHVGIGTSIPAAPLDVRGNSSIMQPHVQIVATEDDFARMTFGNNQGTGRFWTLAGLNRGSNASQDRFNVYHSGAGDVLSATGQGRVGVRTMSPSSTLDVNGAVRIRGLAHAQSEPQSIVADATGNLTAAPLRHITIPAAAFRTVRQDISFFLSFNSIYIQDAGGTTALAAPLVLPTGARIESITATVFDNRPDADLRIIVVEDPLTASGGSNLIATLDSSGSSPTRQQPTVSGLSHAIDAESYQYFIEAYPRSSSWDGSSSLRIHAVTIAYRL